MRCFLALLPLAPAALGESDFDRYLRQFGKAYSGAEYDVREALFAQRMRRAGELNARPDALWRAGANAMSDLSAAELGRHFGYNKLLRAAGSAAAPVLQAEGPAGAELPKAVDWRQKRPPVLTAVKRQGGCGSCWAFSAVESIESHVALSTGVLLELSPQQLNSCAPNPHKCGGTGGCLGATPQLAFNYSVAAGVSEGARYPYHSGFTGESGDCQDGTARVAGIEGYKQVERNSAHELAEAVTHGPVAVSVDAGGWFMYESGIFDGCDKAHVDINHSVLLVGYGEEKGTRYWIIRNSWGGEWGERGYIRLRRHHEEPCGVDRTPQDGFGCEGGPPQVTACGECGVLSDSSYPLGGHLHTKAGGHARRLRA